jgi:hypothetical protein
MVTADYISGGKAARTWSYHSLPYNAGVKNGGAIPTFPHTSSWHVVWLIKCKDNFTSSPLSLCWNTISDLTHFLLKFHNIQGFLFDQGAPWLGLVAVHSRRNQRANAPELVGCEHPSWSAWTPAAGLFPFQTRVILWHSWRSVENKGAKLGDDNIKTDPKQMEYDIIHWIYLWDMRFSRLESEGHRLLGIWRRVA